MFGQIIDLLVKKDDERQKLILWLLKIIFSSVLASKVYYNLIGDYSILSLTDFQGIVRYFFSGRVIICIAIFYLVWTSCYDFSFWVLTIIAVWLSNKIYNYLSLVININPETFSAEIEKQPKLKRLVILFIKFLNSFDVLEIESNTINTGTNYYKFYDYLLDLEDGKTIVSTFEYSSKITLTIQFIIIYNWFGMHFLSYHWWLFALAVFIIVLFLILNFLVFTVSNLIDLKHSRLLNFMEKIEPQKTTKEKSL